MLYLPQELVILILSFLSKIHDKDKCLHFLFTEYKHIKFYKVNEKPVGTSDPINCVVDLWVNNKNVEYITYSTMLDKLK